MDKYETLHVGQASNPVQITVTPEWALAYREATGYVTTPQHHDGHPVAPPMMMALLGRMSMTWIPVAPGAVHAKQSYRFHRPILIGEMLSVQSSIVHRFEKRGKSYLVIGVRATDSRGALVGEGETTRVAPFTNGGPTR